MKSRILKRFSILFVAVMLTGAYVLAGPASDIAEKMKPRDATGDLEKVQGGEDEVTPTPTPRETISGVQLPTLPRREKITRESEEPETPLNLLEDPDVRRILRSEPDYIYDPRDMKDPMIVPWVRHALLIREYLESAKNYVANRRFNRAKSLIKQVRDLLPDIRDVEQRKNAESQIAMLEEQIKQATSTETDIEEYREPVPTPALEPLPAWIKTNITGVIWEPKASDRMVLIGDDILEEGDKIPRYPDARVQKINPSSVVISYRGRSEEIIVEQMD